MRRKRLLIGTVGIDTAQLYLGEPCYVIDAPLGRKPWNEFIDSMQPPTARWWEVNSTIGNHPFRAGMVVKTGYGDGEYPVYITLSEDGRVASVTVEFIR